MRRKKPLKPVLLIRLEQLKFHGAQYCAPFLLKTTDIQTAFCTRVL